MPERTARLIVNPHSGHRPSDAELSAAGAWLEARGWTVDQVKTLRVGHGRELAAEAAASNYDAVLVCGGDGSINEVVNGLAGTNTALALIPAGTVNIWARETGIPRNTLAAARTLHDGVRRRVDLGRANGRYFLMLLSVGVDSMAVASVNPMMKRRWGRMAYFAAGVSDLLRQGGRQMVVTADDERFSGATLVAIAGNSRLYGGLLLPAFRALVDDGLLDLCLYRGSRWHDVARHAMVTLLRRHDRAVDVVYRQVKRITIETETPVAVQTDGEAAGTTPVQIEVVPAALTVVVPRDGPTGLFLKP